MTQLVFPLTDRQMRILSDQQHLRSIANKVSRFGTISVDEDECLLTLSIPDEHHYRENLNFVSILELEERLGVLLTVDEIKKICDRDDIVAGCAEPNPRKFMNELTEDGVPIMAHHALYEQFCLRAGYIDVGVGEGGLFFKYPGSSCERAPIRFRDITNIEIGKHYKAPGIVDQGLVPTHCCFTVTTCDRFYNLSSATMDAVQVHVLVAYIKGFKSHFHSYRDRESEWHKFDLEQWR